MTRSQPERPCVVVHTGPFNINSLLLYPSMNFVQYVNKLGMSGSLFRYSPLGTYIQAPQNEYVLIINVTLSINTQNVKRIPLIIGYTVFKYGNETMAKNEDKINLRPLFRRAPLPGFRNSNGHDVNIPPHKLSGSKTRMNLILLNYLGIAYDIAYNCKCNITNTRLYARSIK